MKKVFLVSTLLLVTSIPGLAADDAAETLTNAVAPETPVATPDAPIFLAPEAILFDNGPLTTSTGTGAGGADESSLQSVTLGHNTLGFGHQVAFTNRIADDFTIPADTEWQIDTITFFAYQTNSPTASTITGVNAQIWDGVPNDPGSTVVWGDDTTNIMTSTAWSNIYRVTETSGGASNRPIMANVATVGTTLGAGTYWVDWQSDGSLGSGPWAPPITILGQGVTGDGLQSTTAGVWAAALDSGTNTPQQGFPFIIDGTALGGTPIIEVPTMSPLGMLGLGLLLLSLSMMLIRRRSTQE